MLTKLVLESDHFALPDNPARTSRGCSTDVPEYDRVRAILAARQLGEDNTGDETLYEDARHRLRHQQDYRLRTLAHHRSGTVAYRVLSLNGEQQRADEIVDTIDAGGPRVIVHVIGVAVTPTDSVPVEIPPIVIVVAFWR